MAGYGSKVAYIWDTSREGTGRIYQISVMIFMICASDDFQLLWSLPPTRNGLPTATMDIPLRHSVVGDSSEDVVVAVGAQPLEHENIPGRQNDLCPQRLDQIVEDPPCIRSLPSLGIVWPISLR